MDSLAQQLWEQHGEAYREQLARLIARRPVTAIPEAAGAREAVADWFRSDLAAALGLAKSSARGVNGRGGARGALARAAASDSRGKVARSVGGLPPFLEGVEVWPSPSGPYLFADWGRSGPTVGFYWHVDVQPVGPGQERLWELAGPEGREASHGQPALWGRGSCDDIGLGLAAWTGIKTALSRCPYNLQFLISTGEESGDKHLGDLIEANRKKLTAEAWFIPDSSRQNGRPAINLSLRGLARFQLEVRGPSTAMHSGMVGGACPDPTVAAFQLLGDLVDGHQRLAVPGLVEVPPEPELEQEFIAASPDREEFMRTAGVAATAGGPDALGILLWRRPSFTIHAVETDVPPLLNAVASFCRVYFSIRLVPGQDAQRVQQTLEAWIAARPIPGIRANLVCLPGDLCEGTQVPRVEPWLGRLSAAMEASYQQPVVFNGAGGTEPVVGLLARLLQKPAYLMGLGGAGEHGPNEHMLVEEAACAMATAARLVGNEGR